MNHPRCRLWPLLLLTLLGAGCSKSDQPFEKTFAAAATAAGLAVQPFEPAAAKPYAAKSCARGQVARLDVLLCSYPSAAAAKQARSKLIQFMSGALNGATRAGGTTLLAVADRKRVDVQGKQLNALLKLFAKLTAS